LPKLYLETGRALVDEAGYLISTVVAVKKRQTERAGLGDSLAGYGKSGYQVHTSAARNALVLDAGVNLLYTSTWYQPSILPARTCFDAPAATTVYGCLCMNIDVIREDAPLPGLTTGDQVVLHPVGAYNITQSMQFITYRPAVVMISADHQVHVIRHRENLAYVEELEEIPVHLAARPVRSSESTARAL
jgi:diaminopimelate decarboxylase